MNLHNPDNFDEKVRNKKRQIVSKDELDYKIELPVVGKLYQVIADNEFNDKIQACFVQEFEEAAYANTVANFPTLYRVRKTVDVPKGEVLLLLDYIIEKLLYLQSAEKNAAYSILSKFLWQERVVYFTHWVTPKYNEFYNKLSLSPGE